MINRWSNDDVKLWICNVRFRSLVHIYVHAL